MSIYERVGIESHCRVLVDRESSIWVIEIGPALDGVSGRGNRFWLLEMRC